MVFGFDTDVPWNGAVYRVQTEDRGAQNPVIESVIHLGGGIVDRVQTPYLPQAIAPSQLEAMVHKQHRQLVELIRSGSFSPACEPPSAAEPLHRGYAVRLLNPSSISRGKDLVFAVSVWSRADGVPAQNVSVDARWVENGVVAQNVTMPTGEDGKALLPFTAPNDGTEGYLLISAEGPEGRALAKFRLHTASSPAASIPAKAERGEMAMRAGAGI